MEKTNLSEPQKIIADITLMNNCFMNKVFASDVKSTQLHAAFVAYYLEQ